MSGASTALRELLIAAADWHGSTDFSAEDVGDAGNRFDAALLDLQVCAKRGVPNPGAVLRSLGWGLVDWAPPASEGDLCGTARGQWNCVLNRGHAGECLRPNIHITPAEVSTNSPEIVARLGRASVATVPRRGNL